uniref:Uncharacterized protein n=1 Tax=Solanum tuberosum TaxID=4113 RepID=M1DHJ2_SOLTU
MKKKVSETDRYTVECVFCNKESKGEIFHHKEQLMGTSKNVVRCSKFLDVVRKEIRRYVEGKKDLKRQILHQSDVTNLDDDDDEEMEEGEASDLSLHTKSQKRAMNVAISSSCGSTGRLLFSTKNQEIMQGKMASGGDSDFTWAVVGEASGVDENRYDLRGNTSRSHRREKEVATSLFLADEVERDSDRLEEDDDQYTDNGGIQDFDNLIVEEL